MGCILRIEIVRQVLAQAAPEEVRAAEQDMLYLFLCINNIKV